MINPSRITSRRTLLTTGSLALAGTALGTRALRAGSPVTLPLRSSRSVDTFLPERMPAADMQTLAAHALDAARSVGAMYADIRIAERHMLEPLLNQVVISTQFSYGVRALIDGAWGFAYGRAPRADAIAQCAKDATATARMSAHLSQGAVKARAAPVDAWLPAPVTIGEWRTPIQIDPFTVPVEQHAELDDAMLTVVGRVPLAEMRLYTQWVRETRVIGATTGTMVTQYLHRVFPWMPIEGTVARNNVRVSFPLQQWRSGGFEILLAADLLDQIKAAAEEATRLAHLPMRSIDIGRYPIVFDGNVMGNLLGTLLGPSLELDRVLGQEAEGSGTSRFSPDLLGTQIVNPSLTVMANRMLPSVTAVQWDDEGNVPQEHTLVKDGMLTDYHTSGQTLMTLGAWYQRQQRSIRSNGCAVAPEANDSVSVRPPHIVMQPNVGRASFDDLCKEMGHGVVALSNTSITTDQQLSSGSINPWSHLFEVSRGQIVRRLSNMGLQFNTIPILKAVIAIGDRTTVRTQNIQTAKGMPWVGYRSSAAAPATLCKEINVMSAKL